MSAKRAVVRQTTKISKFNINGVTKRLPNLLAWLNEAEPDIVCLRNSKAKQNQFRARR